MNTLNIGEGKPTDKTLGELVGHKVTATNHNGETHVVFVGPPQIFSGAYWCYDFRQKKWTAWGEKTEVDLDYGPLTITDAEPVCAPRVEVSDQECEHGVSVLVNDDIVWEFDEREGGAHQCGDNLRNNLRRALSQSPRVEDVRAELMAEIRGCIDNAADWDECARMDGQACREAAHHAVSKAFNRVTNLHAPPADAVTVEDRMTLRDQFAMAIVSGMDVGDYPHVSVAAQYAYEVADAMIAERAATRKDSE